MSTIHNAILVSGLDGVIYEAHSVAMSLGLDTSPLSQPGVDASRCFVVWPDTSPQGGSQSLKFQEYLQKNSIAWAAMSYGTGADTWVSANEPTIDQSWVGLIVELQFQDLHAGIGQITEVDANYIFFQHPVWKNAGSIPRSPQFFLMKTS
jgi:hypothetical protein